MLTPDRILYIHPLAQTPCELRDKPSTAISDGPAQRVGKTRDSELWAPTVASGTNCPLSTVSPSATVGGHPAIPRPSGEAGQTPFLS